MYGFYLAWFFGPLSLLSSDPSGANPDSVGASLKTGQWTPESSYRFWEGVAQGFVHFVTAGFLLLLVSMLAFRPTGAAEAVTLLGLRAWGAFFATGFLLIAVAFFRVWFRRRASEALPPRTNGWWMLLIQVPAAAAFTLTTR